MKKSLIFSLIFLMLGIILIPKAQAYSNKEICSAIYIIEGGNKKIGRAHV